MTRGLRLTPAQFAGIGGKKSKFGNRKKVLDGITFDSTREARRYQDLVLMQKGGQITGLSRQTRMSIHLNGVHICDWLADFTYHDEHGVKIFEDSKGAKTPEYRLKKKLVEAQFGIKILET